MKMVVLEVFADYAVVMYSDGTVSKVKNDSYYQGQEVELKKNKSFKFLKPVFTAAAAMAFLFAGTFALLNIPTTYISMDVNPSIEYSCNIFNRVINITAKNEDAVAIVNEIEKGFRSVDDVIDETVDILTVKGYLKTDKVEEILLATSGYIESNSQQLLDEVTVKTSKKALSNGINPHIISLNTSMEEHDKAVELGTTFGKLALINQYNDTVQEKAQAIPVSDMLGKSVADIVSCIDNKSTVSTFIDDEDDNNLASDEGALKKDTNDDKQVTPPANDSGNDSSNSDLDSDTSGGSSSNDQKNNSDNSSQNNSSNSSAKEPEEQKPPHDNNSSKPNDSTKEEQNPPIDTKPQEPNADDEPSSSEGSSSKDDDKQYAPDFGLDDTIEDGLQT